MFALAASLAAPPAQPAQPTGLTALVPYAESRRSLIQRLTGERLRVHRGQEFSEAILADADVKIVGAEDEAEAGKD